MADEAERPEDEETLELTDAIEGEEEATQPTEDGEQPEETVEIGFKDEEPEPEPEEGNSVIRELRKQLRETQKQLKAVHTPDKPKIEVGPKPTLESCEWDEEVFEQQLDQWKDSKRKAEEAGAEAEKAETERKQSWERAATAYQQRKAELNLPDFEEAEAVVDQALGSQLSPVILKAARDPAQFVAALGRSEAKRTELAAIKDPIELAAAIARMEASVVVRKAGGRPAIDKPISGSGTPVVSTDKQLERLEAEADRTGDRSKIISYKRSLRERGQ